MRSARLSESLSEQVVTPSIIPENKSSHLLKVLDELTLVDAAGAVDIDLGFKDKSGRRGGSCKATVSPQTAPD